MMRTGETLIGSIIRAGVDVDPVRSTVEARGRFNTCGLTSGNQQRRWHGTTRNCNLGDNGRSAPCYSPQCSLCSIIRNSFDMTYAKKKTGWGRFGVGIYTSSTSSKLVGYSSVIMISLTLVVYRSNDYSTNLVFSPWKAILLSYVVVGNGKKFTTDQPTLMQPPAGFDSVRLKFSSLLEISCDCSVGHWRAKLHGLSELR